MRSDLRSATDLQALIVVTLLMVAAALPTFFLGVFAPALVRDFGIEQGRIGILGSLIYVSASGFATASGAAMDRVGMRRGGRLLLCFTASALLLLAVSPSYWFLAAASLLAGVAMAASNPATNLAVRSMIRQAHQRSAVGIKQAGVPLAIIVAGAGLPPLAKVVGWRGVSWLLFALVLAILPWWERLTRKIQRPRGREVRAASQADEWAQRLLDRTRAYALVMGGVAGLSNTFYVLFVVDDLGLSQVTGGWFAAGMGCAGALSRLLWAELGGRRERIAPTLAAITGLALAGTGAMWMAWAGIEFTLWGAAPLFGASIMGWQGFVMVAVMRLAPDEVAGLWSGRVMQAFYFGLLISPISVGYGIELSNSYVVLWLVQTVLLALALGCSLWISKYERMPRGYEGMPAGMGV